MSKNKEKRFYWLLHLCKAFAWFSWLIVFHRKYHYLPNAFKRTKVKGPGIIICNHNHWIEPPLITYTFPFRTIISVISKDVIKSSFGRWFFKEIGMVEINKSAFEWNDFKKILNSLKKGKLVLIFPEGKLNDKEKLANFKEGLVTIAHLANVPIYPIYILPKHKPFHKQHIMLGETIDLHKQFKELNTENCKEMVKWLWNYVDNMRIQLQKEVK